MDQQPTVNLKVDSPLAPPPAPAQPNGNGAHVEHVEVKTEAAPQPEIPQAAETPEEKPPEPWVSQVDGKIKLRLRKKVQAHGDMVDHLLFKEPTGGDIERIGNPVSLGGGNLSFDSAAMSAMMSHLAGVPTSTIRLLHSKDWTNGAYAIWGFFVPDA